jgi:hypothetical protein
MTNDVVGADLCVGPVPEAGRAVHQGAHTGAPLRQTGFRAAGRRGCVSPYSTVRKS